MFLFTVADPGKGSAMSTYEVLVLIFAFANLVIQIIDSKEKQK